MTLRTRPFTGATTRTSHFTGLTINTRVFTSVRCFDSKYKIVNWFDNKFKGVDWCDSSKNKDIAGVIEIKRNIATPVHCCFVQSTRLFTSAK